MPCSRSPLAPPVIRIAAHLLVGDNLRKGAALNAVQIAEALID